MTILDMMKASAELLGLNTELTDMQSVTTENESTFLSSHQQIKKIFDLSKLTIQEFCSNYVPIENEMTLATNNKKIEMSSLTNVLKVKQAKLNDQNVLYKVVNRNLVFDENGTYTIMFTCYPEIDSVFDSLDWFEKFSPDMLVFGLCAYYALAVGMFNEFNLFYDKYVDKANSIKGLKLFDIPQRRWA